MTNTPTNPLSRVQRLEATLQYIAEYANDPDVRSYASEALSAAGEEDHSARAVPGTPISARERLKSARQALAEIEASALRNNGPLARDQDSSSLMEIGFRAQLAISFIDADDTAAETPTPTPPSAVVEALRELLTAFEAQIEGEGFDPTTCDCPVRDRAYAALAQSPGAQQQKGGKRNDVCSAARPEILVSSTPEATEPGQFAVLVDEEWQRLLDKDDRTSPEEYPDMCLITKLELSWAMAEAFILAKSSSTPGAQQEDQFKPCVIEFDDPPRYEFVLADGPCFVHEIAPNVELFLDLDDREKIVGVRVWKSAQQEDQGRRAVLDREAVALAVFKCAFHPADTATAELIEKRKCDFLPTWEHAQECADAILSLAQPTEGRRPAVGVLQEALDRAYRDAGGLVLMPSSAVINILGRNMACHIPDVEKEFSAKLPVHPAREGEE